LQTQAPWRWFAPRRLPGSARAWGEPFRTALRTPPRLAIGCGRQAALATRLLRERGSRAVQILDPRIACRHWDLVVAPEHDGLRGANVITLLGSLHPVDEAWLAAAREAFAGFAALPAPRVALLVGGPSAHARFAREDFAHWAAAVAAGVRHAGGSLLLTTSPSRRCARRPTVCPECAGATRATAPTPIPDCWPGPTRSSAAPTR
jgi:uncharacterized protein